MLAPISRAEDAAFVPATKPPVLEYTTLEKSYKEKDETVAGDVGRFAAFTGIFALIVAYLANSPTEIARRIALAKKQDEERMAADPLYQKWVTEWAAALKLSKDKSV